VGDLRLSRLRSGEWIVGAMAIVLLALMFLAPWYGLTGAGERLARRLGVATSVNGFDGLTNLRWLMLVAIGVALALVFAQASRRAPALPASLSAILVPLAIATSIWLIYRVLIDVPGSPVVTARPAAYLGLAAALALTYGAYRSLREEDRPDAARNAAIPTVDL
jgi:hypothetical protein